MKFRRPLDRQTTAKTLGQKNATRQNPCPKIVKWHGESQDSG